MAVDFNGISGEQIIQRLQHLQATNTRAWGKMSAAQMMAHCSVVLEMAVGERIEKASFVEKLMSPLIKKLILNLKPFKSNLPTGKVLVIIEEKVFSEEKERLTILLHQFFEMGNAIENNKHILFGKLTIEEWHLLTIKHLDHHLKQFNA